MFKLALTAGHYMGTPGKRCHKSLDPNETREWWLNNRIADGIEKALAQYKDIEILRTDDTTGAKEIELEDRVAAANKFDADFYLSIHHNAAGRLFNGGGIEVYAYTSASSASYDWQSKFYDELIKQTGLKGNRSNGKPRANFYEIKYTSMPAILLELGYMDSYTDTPIILTDDFANKCVTACVNVIVAKAGLKKKETKPAPAQKPTVELLKVGSKGDKVLRLQNVLLLLGFDCGKADGDFGSATNTAVRELQRAVGIGVDGIVGEKTYAAIDKLLSTTGFCFSVSNEKLIHVEGLQGILNHLGYKCGEADGYYGKNTKKQVIAYQKDKKLSPDGICGPKTIGTFVSYI